MDFQSRHSLLLFIVEFIVTSANGTVSIQVICSKTKVALLKKMTVPRLELAAATLLTKLLAHVLKIIIHKDIPVYMWTDSTITYTWINSNHRDGRIMFITECIIFRRLYHKHNGNSFAIVTIQQI